MTVIAIPLEREKQSPRNFLWDSASFLAAKGVLRPRNDEKDDFPKKSIDIVEKN